MGVSGPLGSDHDKPLCTNTITPLQEGNICRADIVSVTRGKPVTFDFRPPKSILSNVTQYDLAKIPDVGDFRSGRFGDGVTWLRRDPLPPTSIVTYDDLDGEIRL